VGDLDRRAQHCRILVQDAIGRAGHIGDADDGCEVVYVRVVTPDLITAIRRAQIKFNDPCSAMLELFKETVSGSSLEVVGKVHFMTKLEQASSQMRANKACTASDEGHTHCESPRPIDITGQPSSMNLFRRSRSRTPLVSKIKGLLPFNQEAKSKSR
jgi:hypothetical protein